MLTKHFPMKPINLKGLPKEVKNEIIEAKERNGAFEKNTALRRIAPKPKGGYTVSKIVYWLLFAAVVSAMAYAYTHHIAY